MTPDPAPPEKTGPEIQRDVQRLMGRCLIRIQQYEQLLKAVLAHHEIAGTVETLHTQPALRAEELSDKTLGTLVNQMFESFVVPEGFERDLLPDDKTPTDRASFAHSFRMAMPPEHLAQTKAAVKELVSARNELVHHFLSRFNLWDEQGCMDAMAHLQELYMRIDTHHQELRAWMVGIENARQAAASFIQSEVFLDLLFNGMNPDGSFEWQDTGIVRALREEVRALAGEDWVAFDIVKARMLERHSDQTPQKYRCSSWPQVLNESGEFELTYRRDSDAGPKTAWVRLRPQSPPRSGTKERKRPGRGPLAPPSDQLTGPG
ncbi:OST-HTH/LOTUS domain-containing protein [Acidovorax sp.]|jgi:hypothetical protein|uniref:OST-HTH/LOTUS domain-containing protein n=1 Tax=Acidovorax sp. TaxID=1872122 RepID=UPI0027B89346|nr:OST-HTH/LOTUS domain-containing protein [Acidovorax sp.]